MLFFQTRLKHISFCFWKWRWICHPLNYIKLSSGCYSIETVTVLFLCVSIGFTEIPVIQPFLLLLVLCLFPTTSFLVSTAVCGAALWVGSTAWSIVFGSINEFKLGELPDKALAKERPPTQDTIDFSPTYPSIWIMSRRAGTASAVWEEESKEVGMHYIAFLPVSQQPSGEWCTFWFKASKQFCKHWLGGLFNLW